MRRHHHEHVMHEHLRQFAAGRPPFPPMPGFPGPGGFPEVYVNMIVRAAVDANVAEVHIDEVRIPGTLTETTK